MPDRRPVGDLDMLHRRPIRNRHAPSKTDMPDRQPIEVYHVSPEACWSPMGHVGLRSGMLVSDGTCRSLNGHVGLRWVSDRSPIVIIFS